MNYREQDPEALRARIAELEADRKPRPWRTEGGFNAIVNSMLVAFVCCCIVGFVTTLSRCGDATTARQVERDHILDQQRQECVETCASHQFVFRVDPSRGLWECDCR
jgi:hypothetical protein